MIYISTAISIIIAILIFGAVMLVHEWGHFIAATRCGIFVEEFAIGMGPKLLSTKPAEGKTMYSLRLVPIGGFCKMLGEDADNPDERAFNNKKVSRRMIVMVAGAFMNFLLAFIIFLSLVMLTGYATTTVRAPIEGSPADKAGIREGDRITRINGTRINLYEDIIFELSSSAGKPMEVSFIRDKQTHTAMVTPYADQYGDYKFGFYPDSRLGMLSALADGYQRVGFLDSTGTAFYRIVFYIKTTVLGVVRLITRQVDAAAGMAGPIGIVSMIGETYEVTIKESILSTVLTMLNLCALLSANLGVINLFPLPALDGGRLVFLTFEAIRRKPIAPEREGTVHFVGFVLLMILAVFIAYQDIMKII